MTLGHLRQSKSLRPSQSTRMLARSLGKALRTRASVVAGLRDLDVEPSSLYLTISIVDKDERRTRGSEAGIRRIRRTWTTARTCHSISALGHDRFWRTCRPHRDDAGRGRNPPKVADLRGLPRSARGDESNPRTQLHRDGDPHRASQGRVAWTPRGWRVLHPASRPHHFGPGMGLRSIRFRSTGARGSLRREAGHHCGGRSSDSGSSGRLP